MIYLKKKRFLLVNLTLIIFIIFGTTAFVKASKINDNIKIMLKDFKKNAVYNPEKSTDKIKYFLVSRETKENRPAFADENFLYPGNYGDIIVDLESPYYLPIIREMQTLFVGGHALFSYGEKILEITGNVFRTDNRVQFLNNDYILNDDLDHFVGLRVKEMSEADYVNLDLYLRAQIGKKYNYFYFFNTQNHFYCTDLISRAYAALEKNYNLNQNKGIVTVQDLVISDDTYIFMLKESNKDGTFNVYYLE